MAESLSRFGITAELVPVDSTGNWCRNCAHKAQVIRDAMLRNPGSAIVFIDADARFLQSPDLFATLDCDFACHFRHGELLSGTLYFAPNHQAWWLVQDWVKRCQADPDTWDQKHLQAAVEAMPTLIVQRLPASYCAVFDDSKMCEPEDRVIEHQQASRRLAGKV